MVTFHATTSFYEVHVILKTITRTRTLKGGGFGLTRRLYLTKSIQLLTMMRFMFYEQMKLRFMWWWLEIDYPHKSFDNSCSRV